MKKEDLKAGFLVELRNHNMLMVMPSEEDDFYLSSRELMIYSNHLTDTLEYKVDSSTNTCPDFDIIKVYGRAKSPDSFSLSTNIRELLWKRKDENGTPKQSALDEVCADAVKKWGKEKQSFIVMEELAELIQAVAKFNRPQPPMKILDIRDNIAEEMADVIICLEQLKTIAGISEDTLMQWICKKTARLSEKLKGQEQ